VSPVIDTASPGRNLAASSALAAMRIVPLTPTRLILGA
jgi:hypothetical protein